MKSCGRLEGVFLVKSDSGDVDLMVQLVINAILLQEENAAGLVGRCWNTRCRGGSEVFLPNTSDLLGEKLSELRRRSWKGLLPV